MRPGSGLLRLLVAWLALGLAAAAWPPLATAWAAVGVLLALAYAAAVFQARRPGPLDVTRRVPEALPLGEWTTVHLRLHQPGERGVHAEVFDRHPPRVEVEGLPRRVHVPARGWVEIEYRIRPTRRGRQDFGRTEILRRSLGDLARVRELAGEAASVRVLPNFRPVLRGGLEAFGDRMAAMGVHLQRRRGEGLEFQELRDYRPGDSLRLVDWKATARRGQLVSRQYEDERNQQVVLALDCGRRMHSTDGDLTHLDHVLNAALLLAYVAVRQGDAVGLVTFGGEQRWLPPVRGPAAVTRLLDAVHDLQTTTALPDYAEAATRLMHRQRRRAMVVLLTNLRDEDTDEVLPALATLRRRHLVVLASTRETSLRRLVEQPVDGFDEALDVAAGHHYVAARRKAHRAVGLAGTLTLDVEPAALPSALVARYLEIKRAGRL